MKNLIKILPLLACMLVAQSCSDILDNARPSMSVPPEQALNSKGAIAGVRAGMYADLHSFGYQTQYMLGPESLADNLDLRQSANRFSGLNTNADGAGMADNTYNVSYDMINRANLLINNIPDGIIDKDTKAQYRGEALFIRAFAFHQLVRALGYEPGMTPSTGAGSGFDLGIIIRTKPTLAAPDANYRPRKTVEDVYKQIESDLKDSITLLSQQQSASRTYVQKAAAEALLARVYLYWRKYDLANQYATDALNDTDAKLATPAQVATMFDETTGLNPEGIWILTVDPATESLGVNNSLNVYTANQWIAQVPTQDVMDLYSNNDARLAWFSPCYDEGAGKPKSGCIATHPAIANGQEALELDKWNAERGNYADNIPYLRVSEMLLIQSEARLKGTSGQDPLAPINKLRAARNETALANVTMQNILNERRREFIGEGQRFFDLKRLGRDIRKAPGSGHADVPYYDHRILDNLPYGEVANSQANAPSPDSALVQNPGY